MNENTYVNIGLAISGIMTGLIAGRIRLGRAMNGDFKNGLFTLIKFEQEVNGILRTMRTDMDAGFDLMKDQHNEMLRRLRKHDDDLFDLKARLEKLEKAVVR